MCTIRNSNSADLNDNDTVFNQISDFCPNDTDHYYYSHTHTHTHTQPVIETD